MEITYYLPVSLACASYALKTGHLSDSAICKGFSRRVTEQALGGIPLSLIQVTRIIILNFR